MNEYKFDIKEVVSRTFDLINLPSEGKFYEDHKSSLRIRYLSGVEERILSSFFLSSSGEALFIVLNNLILDSFDVKKLVMSDLQGIMIFLYATSFGDEIKFQVKCPHCGYEEEAPIRLSSLDFKKSDAKMKDGKFFMYVPYDKTYANIIQAIHSINEVDHVEIVSKPLTFGEQMEIKEKGIDMKEITNKISYNIVSIGGNDNKKEINKFIKTMNMKTFRKLKDFVLKNDLGLEDKFHHSCTMCNADNEYNLNLGHDFLKLPESHRQNVLEECFLLSHYNQGGLSLDKAMELPTSERRWAINRLQEEMHKKKEAEEKAANAAKAKASTKRSPKR